MVVDNGITGIGKFGVKIGMGGKEVSLSELSQVEVLILSFNLENGREVTAFLM